MLSDTACVVYDFWQNKVIGKATNSFTAKNIPQNGSRISIRRFSAIGWFKLAIGATEISFHSIKLIFSNGGAQGCFIPGSQAKVKIVQSLQFKVWEKTYGKFRL